MIDMATDTVTERHDLMPEPELFVFVDASTFMRSLNTPDVAPSRNAESSTRVKWADMPSELTNSYNAGTCDILATVVGKCRRDVSRYPASARVRTDLGNALLNAEQYEEAAREYEAALSLDAACTRAALGLARVKVQSGDIDAALDLYGRLYAMRPRDPEVLIGLASARLSHGDLEESAQLWTRAVKLQPSSTVSRVHLAFIYLRQGQSREAIAQLRAAARYDGDSAIVQHNLAVAHAVAGSNRKAMRTFRIALGLAPDQADTIYGLGNVLFAESMFQEAAQVITKYLMRNGHDHKAREMLAWACIKQGRVKEAKAQLYSAFRAVQEAGETDSSHKARLTNNLGVCYWLLKDRTEARKMFLASIGAKAGERTVYHNLVRLYLEEDATSEARQLLTECIQLFPGDEETRLLLAVALESQGRYADAVEELRALIRTLAAPVGAYTILGTLLADWKRDLGTAVQVLREGLQRYPQDAVVINNLAYVHLMQGDVAAARAVLDSLTGRVSGVTEIMLSATRGLLQLWMGDPTRGEAGYREAEQIARRQGKVDLVPLIQQKMHLELARAFLRQGNVKAARDQVRAGLSREASQLYRRDLEALEGEVSGGKPR